MNTITPAPLQTHAQDAHRLEGPIDSFPALASALATTSLLTVEERRIATGISLSCVQCGYDLGKKDDTFALDQCPNCNSKTFRFRISPESNRHWIRIKEQLSKTAPELHEPETLPREIKSEAKTNWRILVAAVLVGIVLFYVLRYWLYSAPIPFIHKPQTYEFILPDAAK